MDQIFNTILKDTYTLTSLKFKLRVLKIHLTKSLFGGDAKEPALSSKDLEWFNSLGNNFYQNFTKDNIYQILNDLENKIVNLPYLIIYLPFETDESTIASIANFARTTFGNPLLLLEIKYDPQLIAGCALSWKGIYRDYSLRSLIEERKGAIVESFKKFLR